VTERLYYHDPSLVEFTAVIVAAGRTDKGYYTQLDRSAFYPTSGGQAHDTGTINGVEISEVIETDDGEIRHLSGEATGKAGDTASCTIDRERRWRHRQMHTAQHILSQAFIRLYDAETVSVHLGQEYGAVELKTKELSEEQIDRAEEFANDVIRDNLPVEVVFAEGEELAALPLRKIPERPGRLRVIKVGGFDCSACGGTHCTSAAEVGLLKITGREKLRGNLLVKFLSGRQALEDYRRRFAVTDRLSQALTCHLADLSDNVEKLRTEHKALRRQVAQLQKELLPARAEQLAAAARPVKNTSLVVQDVSDIDASVVAALAAQVCERIEGVAVLLAADRLVLATSPATGIHAGEIIKKFVARAGLKGGGSDRLAQVGGVTAEDFNRYAGILEGLIADA